MTEGPRIWVGCLAAYNGGELHGEWIEAAQSADELHEEVQAMLRGSPVEGAEEWGIFDYDNFAGYQVGEYESLERVALVARMIDEGHGEAFTAWAGYDSSRLDDLDTAEERFTEQFRGEYDDPGDFAWRLFDETRHVVTDSRSVEVTDDDLRKVLADYMDWARLGEELLVNQFTGVERGGRLYVFSE